MRLLNKSGKLLVTHSSGGKSIQKVLKIAFKDKEAFPNNAKDIIAVSYTHLTLPTKA